MRYPKDNIVGNADGMEILENCRFDFPYIAVKALLHSEEEPHCHVYFEFGYVCSGEIQLILPGRSISLNEGDCYFVNASVTHECKATGEKNKALVYKQMFERNLITGGGMAGNLYVSRIESCIKLEGMAFRLGELEHEVLIHNIRSAFSAVETHESGYELCVCANLNLAWAQLYRLVGPLFSKKDLTDRDSAQRMRVVLAYIHQNYSDPLSIKEIARVSGVCERECFRYFDRYMNTTPMEYLSRYRISMAMRMLVESNQPIKQVAEKCGFQNAGYFSLVFRKMVGKNPREYRKTKNE